jgi:hypothetical protein
MTTIIGIEDEFGAKLAADSLTTEERLGRRYKHQTIPKISRNKDFLIAGSGLAFVCDVVQQAWVPPSPSVVDKKNLYKFMVTKVMPSLRKFLHESGYERTPADQRSDDADFNFLVAVNGEIFEIDDDYGVLKSQDGFYAVGSGAPFALGALYAGADWEQSLQIACKLSVYSEPPFIYFEQEKSRGKDE